MKKALFVLLAVCILCCTAGCDSVGDLISSAQPEEKVFSVPNYPLQIVADDRFSDKTGGSFDLQITNEDAYISIMAYSYTDLPQGTTPQDVYEVQNADIFSKRDAVAVIAEDKTQTLTQGTVTYGVHSAQRDGVENYYATYLIDLPEAEVCAWVLVTSTPSYYTSNTDYLHGIVCSLSAT